MTANEQLMGKAHRILLVLLFFSFFSTTAFSISFNGTQSLYKMDEASGNAIDSSSNLFIGDLPQTGTVPSQAGHILASRGAYNGSNYFSKTGLTLWNSNDSFTVAAWVMPISDTPGGRQLFIASGASSNYILTYYLHWAEDLGGISWRIATASFPYDCELVQPMTLTANQWYFVAGAYNASNNTCYLYVNDSVMSNTAIFSSFANRTDNFFIGGGPGYWESTDFYIEQVSVWNSSLDQDAINWLYNNGVGQNYTSGGSTTVALNYPADASINTTKTIQFGFTPNYSSGNLVNCSLYSNVSGSWGWTEGNTTVTINNSVNTISYTLNNYTTYLWGISCWDETTETFSSNRTLTIYTPPNIASLIQNVTNMSNYTSVQGYQFNATIVANAGVDTVWVRHNFTGTFANYTVTTNISSSYYYNYGSLAAGYYQYQWWANDTGGNLNSSIIHYYQINKGYIPITLYINGTDGDATAYNYSVANFTANFSSGNTFNVSLWSNLTGTLTLWDNQANPLTNYTNLTSYQARAGYFIIANWTGDENYTASDASHYLTLQYWTAPIAPAQTGGGGMITNAPPKKNATSETPKKETPKTVPKQLLDVKLTLGSNRLIDSTELVALTTFQSFGTAPAEVNLTYTFFDSSGKEIYNETDHQVVYTELALERKFSKLVLGAGNYSLVLTLRYVNVTERFRQDFEVLPAEIQQAFLAEGNLGIYILIVSFILAFILAYHSYQLLTRLQKVKGG